MNGRRQRFEFSNSVDQFECEWVRAASVKMHFATVRIHYCGSVSVASLTICADLCWACTGTRANLSIVIVTCGPVECWYLQMPSMPAAITKSNKQRLHLIADFAFISRVHYTTDGCAVKAYSCRRANGHHFSLWNCITIGQKLVGGSVIEIESNFFRILALLFRPSVVCGGLAPNTTLSITFNVVPH